MAEPVVVWGLGQMGGVFAHGFLRCDRAVHPVTRGADPEAVARAVPEPALVLVAVSEADLPEVLSKVPDPWRDRLALLQNELLPDDWKDRGLPAPTVAVVWFEKKRNKPLHEVLPTVTAGPRASVLSDALRALDIGVEEVPQDRLLFELVKKNLYILTANIAGLETGGTVAELWRDHRDLARDVAAEVLALQAWRAGEALPQRELLEGMVHAFEADPEHGCTGRSAPARLRRALGQAKQAGLSVQALERVAARHL
jgi:ketopantoate reductase